MRSVKSQKYNTPALQQKIMGPSPIKLEEELLRGYKIPENAVVCDLGSGQGLTSAFLVKEYGFTVYAADLWSDPAENRAFFDAMGIDRSRIIPVKADAAHSPLKWNSLMLWSARTPTITLAGIRNIWTKSCCPSSSTAAIFPLPFPA